MSAPASTVDVHLLELPSDPVRRVQVRVLTEEGLRPVANAVIQSHDARGNSFGDAPRTDSRGLATLEYTQTSALLPPYVVEAWHPEVEVRGAEIADPAAPPPEGVEIRLPRRSGATVMRSFER